MSDEFWVLSYGWEKDEKGKSQGRRSESGGQGTDFETFECVSCGKFYKKCDSGIKEKSLAELTETTE